jgi:NADH dehydrogenase [ubiquinone] 1 alpha subcomplex assembly factor 7
MGLDVRVALLARNAPTEERARDIENAARRLVDLNGMGTQYRVLGITDGGVVKGKESVVWPFLDEDAPTSSSS